MSVEQIEEQIRQLPINDLGRLTKWLTEYLASRPPVIDDEWEESPEQRAELERRLSEFLDDPSIATPFESNYFDELKRKLADERPLAKVDIESTARWYEDRKPGLGDEFLDEVHRILDAVRENPLRFSIRFGQWRRANLRRFPYAVITRYLGHGKLNGPRRVTAEATIEPMG